MKNMLKEEIECLLKKEGKKAVEDVILEKIDIDGIVCNWLYIHNAQIAQCNWINPSITNVENENVIVSELDMRGGSFQDMYYNNCELKLFL